MSITKEYSVLFNAIADAEQALESIRLKLIAAEKLAEDAYINREGDTDNF